MEIISNGNVYLIAWILVNVKRPRNKRERAIIASVIHMTTRVPRKGVDSILEIRARFCVSDRSWLPHRSRREIERKRQREGEEEKERDTIDVHVTIINAEWSCRERVRGQRPYSRQAVIAPGADTGLGENSLAAIHRDYPTRYAARIRDVERTRTGTGTSARSRQFHHRDGVQVQRK